MKKIVTLLLALLFIVSVGTSLAASCPLPDVNSDAEINFSGFEWYTDYKTTLVTANSKGLVNKYDWSQDHFEADRCVTPHWTTVQNSIASFAGSETGCGGYMSFMNDLPNVAGYKLDSIELYFLYDPEVGPVADYRADNAVQFYMAKYEFDVADPEATYTDLVTKLSSLYGSSPYTGTYGFDTDYTVWVNGQQAVVAIGQDEFGVKIAYCAPGAEDKLVETEEKIKSLELANASGDLSGL